MSTGNALRDLETHVRAIVQPLRAVSRRKRIMQEELLAHLVGAYEQELDGGGDEDLAVERAKRRLGSPELLVPQLQASVPLLEKLLSMCLGRKETFMSRFLSVIGVLAIVALVFTAMALLFPFYGAFINVALIAGVAGVVLVRLFRRDEQMWRWVTPASVMLVGVAGVAIGASVILPALAKIKQEAMVVSTQSAFFASMGVLVALEGLAYIVCGLTIRRPPISQG